MTALPSDLEIERLMNLIRGFGWEMTKKEISDTEIVLTVKKEIAEK